MNMEELSEEMHRKKRASSFFITRKMFYGSLLACASLPYLFVILHLPVLFSLPLTILGGAFLLSVWEKKMRASVSALVRAKVATLDTSVLKEKEYEHQIEILERSSAQAKEKIEELNCEMDRKLAEVRSTYLEYDDISKEYNRLQEELKALQIETQEQLRNKEALLGDYQHTIAEQRNIIEKKQRYIFKLEEKVRDLMYEIRSLLQLEEVPAPQTMTFLDTFEQKEELSNYYLPTFSSRPMEK